MAAQLDEQDSNPALGNLIARQIAESSQQRLTFATYMDLALYHPQYGYYATNAAVIGAKGDFFTSPHLGADFGELLAEQFVQMWEIMQRPTPFTLVEMGAGQGLLAVDILRYLQHRHPTFVRSLEYIIVERAAALIAEQQRQAMSLKDLDVQLRWSSLEALPSHSIVGCFFSNELVDALPVHQISLVSGQLQEIYVTATQGENNTPYFSEVTGELSTPRLAAYFERIGIALTAKPYPDCYRSEVNLAALDWLQTVAERLQRGYVLTIDYGYTSARYYSPTRSQGTLQCYYQHTHHSNPYIHIGKQDITAHVDFTALEQQGAVCGLKRVGFTQQSLFLMALGLGDRMAALSQSTASTMQDIQAALRQRDALHLLINPMGLGNFGVLVQAKGLTSSESVHSLKGLTVPAS
ncbi:class I SAM-dependent methyltransferase [Phormidium sp. FACHB-592]|uniref:Class I SAM-dependent methyltransferase n=1 Tax=Stenomitos frigidus AS-A4 TaxID=2933935 RepID=A0ABV0KM37_9CYAN|nr:class I SAM-dependent methyltransferase [Phormidium sp. FACHB-592]MBD2072431.1 class I SAM-dependent methyltransferase [Phormidium sp. FACHB-592]